MVWGRYPPGGVPYGRISLYITVVALPPTPIYPPTPQPLSPNPSSPLSPSPCLIDAGLCYGVGVLVAVPSWDVCSSEHLTVCSVWSSWPICSVLSSWPICSLQRKWKQTSGDLNHRQQ